MAWRMASTRSRMMAPMISAPTTARCQKSGMPRTGSAAVDGEQQVGAEDRAEHGAAAADDGHAADHRRADRLQLEAVAHLGVDGAVAGREQHPAEAGRGAAGHEGDQHPLGLGQAVQLGGVGVGADRVELASAAGVGHVPGHRRSGSPRRGSSAPGWSRICWVPRARKSSGMSEALIRLLPVHATLMPRKAYSVPSVITMAGTLPNATSAPLTRPSSAPKAIADDEHQRHREAREWRRRGCRPGRR